MDRDLPIRVGLYHDDFECEETRSFWKAYNFIPLLRFSLNRVQIVKCVKLTVCIEKLNERESVTKIMDE